MSLYHLFRGFENFMSLLEHFRFWAATRFSEVIYPRYGTENISVKEMFGFQKLKISFSEILFQKKLPYASLILLFQLCNREEVFM